MKTWPVQEAKARFSELIERALQRDRKPSRGTALSVRSCSRSGNIVRWQRINRTLKRTSSGGPKVDDFPMERNPDTGRAQVL